MVTAGVPDKNSPVVAVVACGASCLKHSSVWRHAGRTAQKNVCLNATKQTYMFASSTKHLLVHVNAATYNAVLHSQHTPVHPSFGVVEGH